MTTYNKEEIFEIKEMFTIWNLCTENVDGLEVMSLLLPNGFLLFDIASSESFCLNSCHWLFKSWVALSTG